MKTNTVDKAKIINEIYNSGVLKIAVLIPSGKKTVAAIDIAAEPIRPITAGLRPVIQPETMWLFLNLS